MTTRGTIIRAALAVALVVLAGILVWAGVIRMAGGQQFLVPILGSALVALAAAGMLFVRRRIGATLGMIAALLGAFWGLLLSLLAGLGGSPPLSIEAVALLVAAGLTLILAMVELATLGLAWVAVAIIVAGLALGSAGNPVVLGILLVVGVVAWLWLRRRRSGSGA